MDSFPADVDKVCLKGDVCHRKVVLCVFQFGLDTPPPLDPRYHLDNGMSQTILFCYFLPIRIWRKGVG